jgi:hypothetical protein
MAHYSGNQQCPQKAQKAANATINPCYLQMSLLLLVQET